MACIIGEHNLSSNLKICTLKLLLATLLCLLAIDLPLVESQGPITPPPKINDRPVIANGRVYYLNHIPQHCQPTLIDTFSNGMLIKDNRAMMKADNPHIIKGNIEIAPSGCLYIEPGSELRFAPGMGMIINGTLIARGSEDPGGRIIMTKAEGSDTGSPSGDWTDNARLVLGNTTRDGRLDLKFRGKWRAICTNYNNFTAIDANVTCRHLGFLKGNFTYHSFSRNLTDHLLWEKPDCQGGEDSLFDCPGARDENMHTGMHICDGQEVIGFECEGLRPGLALDHWRGLDFYNSTTEKRFLIQDSNRVYVEDSVSFLEYLDISYTGLDTYHGQTSEPGIFYPKAAISASPHVPIMNNVTIRYGAYDALNLTEIEGPIHIANSTVSHNRGHGMYIQTSVGQTLINTTEVSHNWGDGIKWYLSNLTIFDFNTKFPPGGSMCAKGDTQGQVFPFYQYLDLIQVDGNKREKIFINNLCERNYVTAENMRVTIHFLIMERDPEASGELIIRDGDFNGQVLKTVKVDNGTFPESVTSFTNALNVQFKFKYPNNKVCKVFPSCLRFLLELTSAYDVEEEFRLLMSNVHDNIGHGVNIHDMRSKIRISNRTDISFNGFGAGVKVYRGAGQIVINGTRIEGNQDAGVNITYSGGFQLINGTELIGNHGYGMITEYLRLNRTRQESQHLLEIVRSKFEYNEFIGLRVGNYCHGGQVTINQSHFNFGLDEAIEYLSCNVSTNGRSTRLDLLFNYFNNNQRHAILLKPILNTEGSISHNEFTNHTLGAFRIDNGYDLLLGRWYREFPVKLNIEENTFKNNSGRYVVNFRLTQYSSLQRLSAMYNFFEENEISEAFQPYLKPRSRASAVVVLSSSNVHFRRNRLHNPLSVRELATHLVDPSIVIDAKENYWGFAINSQQDYEAVFNAIFDQNNRYNLAQLEYHPALRTLDLRASDNMLANSIPQYQWTFNRGEFLGGGLLHQSVYIVGRGKTYFVDRDIYIYPNKTLLLELGATLKFAPSVGMVVHGLLRADGSSSAGNKPITFTLDDREEWLPLANRTASIRLQDGDTELEGRLEVDMGDGVWGTVCSDGWIEENALLACQQLGLVYNRDFPHPRIRRPAPVGTPVLMSWVSCEELDLDLTKCKAINGDAQNCGHEKDVFLKCNRPTWAGITLAAAYWHDQAQGNRIDSQLRYVNINKAGMMDSDTATLSPALRIDYNYYQISWLKVEDALSDGIHVFHHHPYFLSKMEYVTVNNCGGNGIFTRSPNLQLMDSQLYGNWKAGFLYDPFFTEYDALLVRNMIYPARRLDMFAQSQRKLATGEMMFLICPAGQAKETEKEYIVEISSPSSTYKLVLQVLDYLPVETVEKVTVFDSGQNLINNRATKKWEIERDLVDFPIISGGSALTIKLVVNGQKSGRLAFAVNSVKSQQGRPKLHTAVTKTSFISNDQGIVTKHYNSPSNQRLELFHRHHEEAIAFRRVKVTNSARHAMHMPSVTKFHEDYIPTYTDMTKAERLAKISYSLELVEFLNNGIGLLAEHNHVDFANNIWQWSISQLAIQETSQGGLEIEVPRVNEGESGNSAGGATAETREVHKVKVTDSHFLNNYEFAFTIAGYYAEVNVDYNEFRDNQCRMGLVAILGMEKKLTLNSNVMAGNDGRFAVDVDIDSHYEFYGNVNGTINLNQISGNSYTGPVPPGAPFSPKTFAVAVKGLQSIQGNRNIFENPDLDYEFVAGVESLTFGNPMDVRYNYWGVTDELLIRSRIFDFDDWNNYVIAEYFPYLTEPDVQSRPSTGLPDKFELDSFQLGGRVDESRILPETGRPFVVDSDLTIMPGVTLTIPAGADLQFKPNVGILVLGRLIANGLPYSRIKFRPIQPSLPAFPRSSPLRSSSNSSFDAGDTRRKRASEADVGVRLRGSGTLFRDAGFLELYNTSTRTWNLMCDSQFNEKTAEVVCRALGMETVNVQVRFTHLYDHYIFGKPMYFRKEFWFNSYHCRGDENSLRQCITRYNYNLLPCIYAANYTFITCGKRNLDPDLNYWGNIRFADDSYEEKPLEADIGKKRSSLTYVDIEGAGMLHGEKVGTIQTTYVTPMFQNINITACVDNGYDIIAPRRNLDIQLQNITGNLGYGINILVLNGESSERRSSFSPSSPSTMPYQVHGMVDMCRLEKEIQVNTRALLSYKYGPQTRDCVKIIRAPFKAVGLRLLQVNLLYDDFSRNSIEIFDGTVVSESSLLVRVVSNSSDEDIGALYRSTGDTLAVLVHASVGHNSYGFIAEVVRLPLAGLTYPDNKFSHTIQHAEIRHNERGALRYKNVGETTPSLYMEHCWLADNGLPILNLTSPPTIDISLQSTIAFRFSHNQVSHNSGGMYFNAHTTAMHAALRGNITNNVFAFGVNGEALNISGHYFQGLMFHQNYIYNYTAGDYRDVIHVKDVVVNLTHNYILRNVGHYIIHTYNSEDGTESQIFVRNGIYDNNATALRESTIKVGVGRPKFTYNYLYNNLNDFEIETYPKTRSSAGFIDARSNWWGSEREAYINGKTYDYSDDPRLAEVNFWPPILDARSVIEGQCLPGWVQDKNRCYRYMGGALPFQEAREFCKSHGAFLAEARGREGFFNYLVRLMVIEQDWAQKVWVMADLGLGRCSAFEQNYIVYEEDCTRKFYPFICETDPDLRPSEELTSAIKAMILGICLGVGGVILIIVIIILVLWCLKSKRREKERFERTASIRSSLNNLNKINGSLRGTKSTLSMMSVGASRRRLSELDQRSLDSSLTTKHSRDRDSAVSNGTSVHSVHSVSSGMDVADQPQPAEIRPVNALRPRDAGPARPPPQPGARQVHSLRPDRSAGGLRAQIQAGAGAAATLPAARGGGDKGRTWVRKDAREQTRRPERNGWEPAEDKESVGGEGERGKFADDSDNGSVDKEDFDSDSTFDEEDGYDDNHRGNEEDLNVKDMQYHVNRSNERLIDRPWEASRQDRHRSPGPLPLAPSGDSDASDYIPNPHKSKSLSSFLDQGQPTIIPPSRRALLPPLSSSRDNLSSPPQDPSRLQSSPELSRANVSGGPRPAPKPKPLPLSRKTAPVNQGLYNNEPLPNNNHLPPLYDSVYEGSNRGGYDSSASGSRGFPKYDPVYDPSTDHSRSTDRYEPVEFNPHPVVLDQAPDTDYMPRPTPSNLGRERLGAPPPVPLQPYTQPSLPTNPGPHPRIPLESDIDSYMSDHGGPSLPRKYKPSSSVYSEDSVGSSRFNDPLPPKPGAPSPPSVSGSQASYTPHWLPPHSRGSRDDLRGPSPQVPQPPPYSTMPKIGSDYNSSSRHGSRDRGLDYAGATGSHHRAPASSRGSRDGLNELPPPYSPGDRGLPPQQPISSAGNRGSRNDILYLGQGARPKHNESMETEI
ncbi:class a scavenger receptor srcr domain with c-type lectin domain [Plakobranchus ocellatus]|uniref:Class a scavenger receptor srcr domain with c-type lectin domain n=1 Tax=Plakobranchus ocellatus TaxID=259542 RepID=A0AAV4C5H9_9GAST|nr:class a scavenger receptor srcr domain with c-type lectin domain [Plakobranchus ocellatus]